MKIIAGIHKGRKLYYHQQENLRPTTSRVKEALFNILGAAINDSGFLDLFAGCGGVGLEAISRGASLVVFAEINHNNCRLIHRNLKLLNETAKVYQGSYEKAIKALERENYFFDYIYLDPEYQASLAKNCLQAIGRSSIINDTTIIIAEHSCREDLPTSFSGLSATRRETYGDSGLTFYLPK